MTLRLHERDGIIGFWRNEFVNGIVGIVKRNISVF